MSHFFVVKMPPKSKEFFLSLFDKTPELRVLVFSSLENNPFTELLQDELVEISPRIKEIYYTSELATQDLKLRPRSYEFVVVVDVFNSENTALVEQLYHALENSANIIVLSNKASQIDHWYLQNLLEDNDFRAVNSIDIFDEYYLVTGKKMHMWGSGL